MSNNFLWAGTPPLNPVCSTATCQCAAKTVRIAELERICAEAYQVVGALAADSNVDVTKILGNLSKARLVHEDVLPFSAEANDSSYVSRAAERSSPKTLREISDDSAISEVFAVFSEATKDLYYDEIADRLALPLPQVVNACNQLMKDGLIGVRG